MQGDHNIKEIQPIVMQWLRCEQVVIYTGIATSCVSIFKLGQVCPLFSQMTSGNWQGQLLLLYITQRNDAWLARIRFPYLHTTHEVMLEVDHVPL